MTRRDRIDVMADEIGRIISQIPSDQNYEGQISSDSKLYSVFLKSDAKRVAHIFDLLPPTDSTKILEIGIGYGYVAVPLRTMFPTCSVSALDAPTRDYVNSPVYKVMLERHEIDLRLADITTERFPFDDGSFDVVIFSETMEHLSPTSLVPVFTEILRCLRVGGRVIVTTPNALRLRNRIRFLLGRSVFESPASLKGGTYGHIREYSHAEVVGMLQACGFHEASAHRCSVQYPILFNEVDRLISGIGSMLSQFSITFDDFVLVQAFRQE